MLSLTADRNRRIWLAVKSSMASKGVSALLQLFAIPFVARSLGVEGFGMFTILAGLPAYLTIADLGMGPALARVLARTNNRESWDAASAFSSALLLASMSALVATSIIGLGGPYLLGRVLAENTIAAGQLQSGCWVVALLVGVQFAVSVGAKARIAYQELHINNLFGAAGNSVVILGLIGVSFIDPTPVNYLVALFLPPALAGAANLATVVLRRRYLLRIDAIARKTIVTLMRSGFLFTAGVGIYGLVREVARFLVVSNGGLEAAGKFGLVLQVLTIVGGFSGMVTGALFPGLNNAAALGDWTWFQNASRRIVRHSFWFLPTQGVCVALILTYLPTLMGEPSFAVSMGEVVVAGALQVALVAGNVAITYSQIFALERLLCLCALGELLVVGSGFYVGWKPLIFIPLLWMSSHLLFSVGILGVSVRQSVKMEARESLA